MNFAGIISNDIVDNDNGICVSLWFNGCPHRCKGCHNSQLWDATNFIDNDLIVLDTYKAITDRNIIRDLSILGGEPLSEENRNDCLYIISKLKELIPNLKINVWTGYLLENIKDIPVISQILNKIDRLIDGPFILEQKKSLNLRGSENQRILYKGSDF